MTKIICKIYKKVTKWLIWKFRPRTILYGICSPSRKKHLCDFGICLKNKINHFEPGRHLSLITGPSVHNHNKEEEEGMNSMTRLGDLLDFGQLFKAFGNNQFAQISYIIRQFFIVVKIFNFSREIIFGQLL